MKASSILGINARTQLYTYKYNNKRGKNYANSKIQTARLLKKAKITHPKIFKKFREPSDVVGFDWSRLPNQFALKPSRGLGGEGIIVVKEKVEDGVWLTTQKEKVTIDDLKLHTLDTLEGAYSIGNVPDVAFVQEYVGRATIFQKWAFRGTPDIRIIVFNKVPVMAMLRLPTRESGGRANLHQGAVGVGIDMATGITTTAIWHGEQIVFKPETKRKLRGIKIPQWTLVLETAVNAQLASGLGYLGVDIVLHPTRGPMVLELNAQPGLQIQMANMEGLKRRLDRVEDLDVIDSDHGVKIAKAIFAGKFTGKVLEKDLITIGASEEVEVVSAEVRKVKVMAKIDTGAWSSSIDRNLATELGLLSKDKILWYRKKMSALGESKWPVINVTFFLAGKRIKTQMGVSDRSKLTYKVLIGRTDLQGFLVRPWIDKSH